MAASYDDWIGRARAHLAEARPIDALSCFRKAARLAPRAIEPCTGMAESLWRLGKTLEAIAAWREALARSPEHLPTWQALAQAATFVGDDALAVQAAEHVRASMPGNTHARFVIACANLGLPAIRDAACTALQDIFASKPHFLKRPGVAHALARAMARVDAGDCRPLRSALAARADVMPLDLLASVAVYAATDVLRARIDEAHLAEDADGLRQIAYALAQGIGVGGDGEMAALSQHAADRYCALCAAHFAATVPLLWPYRTAGARARLIVLADTAEGAATAMPVAAFNSVISALQVAGARIDLAVAVFGDGQRMVERLRSTSFIAARVTQMPERPDIESARSLAASDPDVLIDLCGLARATGPLFAARPARAIWSLSGTPQYAQPLVDALLPGDHAAWPAVVAQMLDRLAVSASAPSAADALHARLAQGMDAHRAQKFDDAIAACDAVLREQPGHAPTLHLRAAMQRDAGDARAAEDDFTAALAVAPRDARARVALAQLALAAHRAGDARQVVETGLALGAADAPMLRVLGHAALAQRDGATAVNAFAGAMAIEPFDAETHFNHGVALQMLRYLGDAARAYQRALDIAPSLIDAHFNLGIVFDQLGETDSAIAALEYVLKRQPARADAHRTLLDVLSRNDRGGEWMRAFQRFESRCPDALGLVANALEYYQYMGNFAKVHAYVERLSRDEFKPASELDLVDSLEQLLYLMLFFDIEPGVQASLYSTYDEAVKRVYGEPLPPATARKPGPLRIGYLSADLRDHVMGKMMLPALREHDRTRFAIHLYSTAETEDAVTAQFRAMGDPCTTLSGMSDDEAVQRIAEADLDILVDLSTHTRGARPGIVARKPARIAITHVASAGALGMSAVDFKLTDRHADLPENDEFLVESLLAMEGCVYPFRRMQAAREHPFHRAALGVSDDAIIIGAFVTPLKLSRRTMALWKEILDRVPRARIAFSPNLPWLRDTYPRILAAANIDPGRAIMLPQGRDEAEGLARYELVDFVLDPTPFGNVNGTIEPLNLGIPVVTLCGRTHGERTGYSILTSLGVTSTIAMSGREYVAIAARLADDRDFRAGVRQDILARLADSPLTDMQGYARRLESAYRQAMAQTGHDIDP